MDKTGYYSYKNFLTGAIITSVTGAILIIASFVLGKNEFFLLLNRNLGAAADYFFSFCTKLGDGLVWAVVAIYFLMHRKKSIPLLISAIVISTLLTQVTKIFIFPGYLRPTAAIENTHAIHTVLGIELLKQYSFPSGHTATATSIFLLCCLLIKKKWVIPAGFMYTLLVGYSRIYLAQHYPLDVGGGMIAGVITVFMCIEVQKWWERRSTKNIAQENRK